MKTQDQKRAVDREKNVHYPRVSFRVHSETIEKLKEAKGTLSWNLFFVELLKLYDQYGRTKE